MYHDRAVRSPDPIVDRPDAQRDDDVDEEAEPVIAHVPRHVLEGSARERPSLAAEAGSVTASGNPDVSSILQPSPSFRV
jgi:hypothetical protein